jgi:hypothetical protein
MLWALLPGPLLAVEPDPDPAPAPTARDGEGVLSEREVNDVTRVTRQRNRRLFTCMTDHYLVLSSVDQSTAADAARLLERIHDRFYRSFEKAGFRLAPLRSRLTWVIFDGHDEFDRYAGEVDRMDMSQLDGYYSARTNRVALIRHPAPVSLRHADVSAQAGLIQAMFAVLPISSEIGRLVGTVGGDLDVERSTHEAAHQLAFNTGLQERGVMYPLWVSEGLATHFETDRPEFSDGRQSALGRRRLLLETQARGRLLPLDEFVTVTRLPPDNEAVSDREVYAEAWGLFRFLFEEHGGQLKTYLAALAGLPRGWRDDDTLRREFIAAFGPIGPLEESWTRFLGKIRALAPSRPHAPDVPDMRRMLSDGH